MTLMFFLVLGGACFAQQDAMFTKYMFNSLVYNPAYAGSKEHMAIGLLHRTQWWGIQGAPTTQSLTIHTPLRQDRVGVGLSLVNDAIGPTHTIAANLSYAYRIKVGSGKLAVGIQGGMTNWRANWDEVTRRSPDDPAFGQGSESFWLPNFGLGLYYYTKYFYAGMSSPHLIEYDLRDNPETELYARQVRHYYATVGGAIPLKGDDLILKPSLLVKNVGLFSSLKPEDNVFRSLGAPTEFDIDVSVLFYQTLWLGTSFRSAIEVYDDRSSFDSVDVWFSYLIKNGLRIGGAFDYTLTQLGQPAQGSFELMVGYEMSYKDSRIVTPRYF